MDAMMQALALNEEEREVIGLTIACGGMNAFGMGSETVCIDKGIIDKILKQRGLSKEDLTSEEK